MFFDLYNVTSLREIYLLVSNQHDQNNLGSISNFLEYLTLLLGIKPGYMGLPYDINLENAYELIGYINSLSTNDFVFICQHNMIVNKAAASNILYKYGYREPVLKSISQFKSPYTDKESVVVGELLCYPCAGIDWNNLRENSSISFYLKPSQIFKELFSINKEYIQINGSSCKTTDLTDSKLEYIKEYQRRLDSYFSVVGLGQVKMQIK